MLYNLDYVPNHGLYKLHDDILNFFKQATYTTRYVPRKLYTEPLNKLVGKSPELKAKLKSVFKLLNKQPIDKTKVYTYLVDNNQIEKILKDKKYSIKTLPTAYDNLKSEIFSLYEFLWKNTVITQTCCDNYGSIDDHYTLFYKLNKEKKICAFCGLEKIKRLVEQRNEYDHYLYKATYPWLAINFHNLVPMCDTCNKRPNKGTKNVVLYDNSTKRRCAYYPYKSVKDLNIRTTCQNLFEGSERFDVNVTTSSNCQELTTWKNVFRIHLRYSDYTKDEYENWLKDLFNYNKNALPVSVTNLRKAIKEYFKYRDGMAKQPGDHLEFAFWNYLLTTAPSDLKLILEYFKERSLILAA